MLEGITLSFFLFSFTPWLVGHFFFRRKSFDWFDQLLHLGSYGILLNLSSHLPFGIVKTVGCLVISAGLTAWVSSRLNVSSQNSLRATALSFKMKGLLSFLLLVLVADQILLFSKNGWSFQSGHPSIAQSYFRGPFNNDPERNLILAESLLRHSDSPFLPNYTLKYQVFAYHFFAEVIQYFEGLSRYGIASGVGLYFSSLFYMFFLWAICLKNRGAFTKVLWIGLILTVLGTHSDLIHGMVSWFTQKKWAIEADGSYTWFFFRHYSTKLVTLFSPQHALFFCFFLFGFLQTSKVVLRLLFYTLAFLCSPTLFVIVIPLIFGQEWKNQNMNLKSWLVWGISLYLIHYFIFGFGLEQVFLRRAVAQISLRPWNSISLWGWLPFLWVGTSGVAGVIFSLMNVSKHNRSLTSYFILGSVFCSYFLFYAPELQRHVSLVVSVMIAWYLLVECSYRAVLKYKTGFLALVLISFVLQGDFVRRFIVPPSVLDVETTKGYGVSYLDYFRMNQQLRTHYPKANVIAAISFSNGGFPIAMEAVTSFSMPMDGFIYHRLSDDSIDTLYRAWSEHLIVPYALKLGYDYILWGPIEEKVWGKRVKQRFVNESDKVLEVGSVALFRLKDHLWFEFTNLVKAKRHRHQWSDMLFENNYLQEAFDETLNILARNPTDHDAKLLQAQIWFLSPQKGLAMKLVNEVLENDSQNVSARELKKKLLSGD